MILVGIVPYLKMTLKPFFFPEPLSPPSLQVMLLWLVSFWMVGSWLMPVAVQLLGLQSQSFSMRHMALYHLATDLVELAVGLGLIWRCLLSHAPLPPGWFPFSFSLSPPKSIPHSSSNPPPNPPENGLKKGPYPWLKEVLWGCLLFPLVHALARLNLKLLPGQGPRGVRSEAGAIRDPIALLVYVGVVTICAPIWEEVIFRGFLLPSLTRYLPNWGAILASSALFALAHCQPQRLLPLLFLGVLIGAVFVRSRNLLASMLLHSLWNAYVFLELLIKAQM